MSKSIESELIKRYQGCLVGAAVGDALGAPVEFLTSNEINKQYGIYTEMTGGGFFNWRPGQTTDDTDMSMAILNSIVENGRYMPEDIARRFVAWMEAGPPDIGGMTRVGLSAIASGADFKDSGRSILPRFGTAPNGSIMRTASVGLIFRGQPERMFEASDEISAMTHAHPDCLLACRMASSFISDLASGKNKAEARDLLMNRFKDSEKAMSMVYDAMRGEFFRDMYRGGGYAFETFNIAFHTFMYEDNFEDTLVRAISFGGDTDTQATVAGAFAGAHYGVDQIPFRWRVKLNPFTSSEIEEKAKRLYFVNK